MKSVSKHRKISSQGKVFFASTFPVADHETIKTVKMEYDDIVDVSDHFQYQFENAGYMRFPDIYTCKTTPKLESPKLLGHILEKNVDEKYYVTDFSKWAYLKGSKHINRKAKTGHEYTFSEGAIAFPDPWDRPARTMLTSESSLNRTTHIVCDPGTGRLRTLTPVETERIQGFDDNWTKTGDTPEKFRYFEMGECAGCAIDNADG
jgi:DNA (cytosine-5)-methyltransferase 1